MIEHILYQTTASENLPTGANNVDEQRRDNATRECESTRIQRGIGIEQA